MKIHVYRFPGILSAVLLFLMVYFGFVQPSEWAGVIRAAFHVFLGVTAAASLVGVFVLLWCGGLQRNYYAQRGSGVDSGKTPLFLARVVVSSLPVLFGLYIFWTAGHTMAFVCLLVSVASIISMMLIQRRCKLSAGRLA